MAWVRGFVVFLGLLQAGYMTFDGAHALVRGNYITPSTGPYAGRLGPWESVVEAAGIRARSVQMKLIFIAYGSIWLAATYYFARGARWGRAGAILTVVGSLWWIGPATFLALTQLMLLILLPPKRPPPVIVPAPPIVLVPAAEPEPPPAEFPST